MQSERRILVNAATLAMGEVFSQLANLVFVVVFARHYGAVIMGDYSFAMATGAVASLAVSLGTHGYLLRELSREPQRGAAHLSLLAPVQLLAAILVWLTAAAVTGAVSGTVPSGAVLMTVGYQVLYRYAALFYLPFRSAERMWSPVLADLGHRVLTLAGAASLMSLGAGPAATLGAMFASAVLFALTGWLLHARSFGAAALRFSLPELKVLLMRARPFFGVLLLSVLYARGGPILLGALGDRADLGAYAAADRILVAATLLPVMLGNAAYPALARTAARSTQDLRALTGRLLRLMLLAGLSSAAFLIAFAHDVILAMFGAHYLIAVPALQLLSLSVPVQGAEQLVSGQLSAMDRQVALVRIRSAVLACFLCVAPVAILFWGITGLAAAVLCCALLELACGAMLLHRAQASPLSLRTLLAPFGAIVAVLAVQWCAAPLPLGMRLAAFVPCLVAAFWFSRAIRLNDLRLLRSMLSVRGAPSDG